jgi:hypothetical protein
VDLIKRVITVSLKTVEIVENLPEFWARRAWWVALLLTTSVTRIIAFLTL